MNRVIPAVFLFLCILQNTFGKDAAFTWETEETALTGFMEYMETAKSAAVSDVLDRQEDFKPWNPGIEKPEDSESNYWFTITLHNTGNTDAYHFIMIPKGYFWRCSIYEEQDTGSFTERESFNSVRRPLTYQTFSPYVSFPVNIPGESKKQLLLRVSSYDPGRFTPFLLHADEFRSKSFVIFITVGGIFGIMAAVLLYTIMLSLSLKERSLIYFVVFQLLAILYILFENGLGLNIFPGADFRFFEFRFVPVLSGFVVLFLLLFTQEFFLFDQLSKRFTLWFRRTVAAAAGLLVFTLIPWEPLASVTALFSEFLFYVSLPGILAAGIYAVHRQLPQAKEFFTVWVLFISGIIISYLSVFNIRIPFFTFIFLKADQLTVVFLMISLTMVVTGRVKHIREERLLLKSIAHQAKEKSRERERLYHEKSMMMAAISHELRTPISSLRLLLEGIAAGIYGRQISNSHEIFTRMIRQTDRITFRTENLLEYTKEEFGILNPRFKLLDTAAFLNDIIPDFKSLAAEKNIEIQFHRQDQGIYVNGDPDMIESVFSNIVENSIKFTPGNGRVSITLSINNGFAEVRVDDTGPGIPEKFREYVLNPFIQQKNGSDNPGFGLGLSLVKSIVSLHDGIVEITENDDGGTRVTVKLPLGVREQKEVPADTVICEEEKTRQQQGAVRNRAITILLIEDDQDMRLSLRDYLSHFYQVETAENGETALPILRDSQPDLIISDIMMEGMDGIELLRTLRRGHLYNGIPLIFLTAKGDIETELEGLQLGAVDYIRKPIKSSILLARINNMIGYKEELERRLRDRLIDHIQNWNPKNHADASVTAVKDHQEQYGLTKRQAEVLDLIIKGYTNKEIAEIMELSPRTVENHVGKLLIKFNVDRRTQLSYEIGNNTHHNE
jgi:signal transduction histidine kinase/DNA-binding NarL/FixJ family response regulator